MTYLPAIMELFVIAGLGILVFGSGYLKKREDAMIEEIINGLHQKYGDKAFFIDNMRRARKFAIMGGVTMDVLAALSALTLDRDPGFSSWIIGSVLLAPIWFLIFRHLDYVTILTPDFIENLHTSSRDRFTRIDWDNVSDVSFAWNNGYPQVSIKHLGGYVMKVHMSKPDRRFRDLVYTILDYVPETRLDGAFREYRQERETLKNQQASTKPIWTPDLFSSNSTPPLAQSDAKAK
jgi:hypothetical protein